MSVVYEDENENDNSIKKSKYPKWLTYPDPYEDEKFYFGPLIVANLQLQKTKKRLEYAFDTGKIYWEEYDYHEKGYNVGNYPSNLILHYHPKTAEEQTAEQIKKKKEFFFIRDQIRFAVKKPLEIDEVKKKEALKVIKKYKRSYGKQRNEFSELYELRRRNHEWLENLLTNWFERLFI